MKLNQMDDLDIRNSNFWGCIDQLQDAIDVGCKIVKFDKISCGNYATVYQLLDRDDELVCSGDNIGQFGFQK